MNPADTEPEHHASLSPILTQSTTHSELVPRSTSPRIDISKPSSVSSITPLHRIPTTSFSVEKDDTEILSNKLSARPLPVLPKDSEFVPQDIRISQPRMSDRARSIVLDRRASLGPRSGLDWIVPLDDKPIREKTVGERLDPTLLNAITQQNKYTLKAKLTGYALNVAIGMQVVLGALTTGLSVVTTGRQTSIMTAILGGLATIVASYLARARGSNEPELSITRAKNLDQFIRECETFKMDHGHVLGNKYDRELENFRLRFEELLGNVNGERRLTPPV